MRNAKSRTVDARIFRMVYACLRQSMEYEGKDTPKRNYMFAQVTSMLN